MATSDRSPFMHAMLPPRAKPWYAALRFFTTAILGVALFGYSVVKLGEAMQETPAVEQPTMTPSDGSIRLSSSGSTTAVATYGSTLGVTGGTTLSVASPIALSPGAPASSPIVAYSSDNDQTWKTVASDWSHLYDLQVRESRARERDGFLSPVEPKQVDHDLVLEWTYGAKIDWSKPVGFVLVDCDRNASMVAGTKAFVVSWDAKRSCLKVEKKSERCAVASAAL